MLDFGQGWRQLVKWAMAAVAIFAILLLPSRHLQHVVGILPLLLLLAWPLMHLFGHGHHHHASAQDHPSPQTKEAAGHG